MARAATRIAPRTSFGPGALLTPANAVTASRAAATPFLVLVVTASGASWLAAGLWAVLALTDGLDGFIARRQGATRSGAFLDPLADKLLVLGAMGALVATGLMWWVPVGLIAGREVAISLYRVRAGRRGVSIPARRSAKAKTLIQDVAVGLALIPPLASRHTWAVGVALWVAVVLTLTSGVQYLLDARRAGDAGAL